MLSVFAKTKTIDISQLSKMDALIKQSERDQIRALSRSLPLDVQRAMFGAIRNIHISIKTMKEKLKTASLRHENPTTAEQALELMESLSNVADYIDPFTNEGRIIAESDEIAKFSRILYRKAKSFGFSEGQQTQLKEAGITKEQVESFVSRFDDNVSQELGIEEEVKPAFKNNNRNVSAS
jgi:hypothetical protein